MFLMPSGKIFMQANYSTTLWDYQQNTEEGLPDIPDQMYVNQTLTPYLQVDHFNLADSASVLLPVFESTPLREPLPCSSNSRQ